MVVTQSTDRKGIVECKTRVERVGNDDRNKLMNEANDDTFNVRNEADGGWANKNFTSKTLCETWRLQNSLAENIL